MPTHKLMGEPNKRGRSGEDGRVAVDVHTHLVPKGWPDLSVACGGSGWPWLRIDSERSAMIMVGSEEFRPIGPQTWDPAVRRADMDADGIDLQVVSPTPVFFAYDRPADQAVKVARIFNDLTLETLADDNRFVPFCQVPLQDPDAACAELDRCALPRHLRICFAHGGGSFAFWLGRVENAWHRRGDIVRGCSEHPPSYYLDRFFVDTVVFESAPLRLLVDTLGEDRVLVGSDYPYPLGERPVGEVVRKAGFLTADQQHKLLAANALRYLGRSDE